MYDESVTELHVPFPVCPVCKQALMLFMPGIWDIFVATEYDNNDHEFDYYDSASPTNMANSTCSIPLSHQTTLGGHH